MLEHLLRSYLGFESDMRVPADKPQNSGLKQSLLDTFKRHTLDYLNGPRNGGSATDPMAMGSTQFKREEPAKKVKRLLPIVCGIENKAVRAFLVACSKDDNPEWTPERTEKRKADMEAAILTGDPLDVALDLQKRVPARRGLPYSSDELRRLLHVFDQIRQRAWELAGDELAFNDAQMREAIRVMGELIASGCNQSSDLFEYNYWHITRAAAADEWPKWEEPLKAAISAAFGGRTQAHKNVVVLVERILDMTELTAADIPEMAAVDDAVAKLDKVRAHFAAQLGEPMGGALFQVLDTRFLAVAQDVEELDAVRKLSPSERGQALVRFFDVIESLPFEGVTHWGQLARESDKYLFGINYERYPRTMGLVIEQLFKRKIELADPDADLARTFRWLEKLPTFASHKFLKLCLETAQEYPAGKLVNVLREWAANPGKYHPLKDHRVEVEEVLRHLPSQDTHQKQQGFGKQGSEAAPSSAIHGLPPLPPPEVDFVSYACWSTLQDHFYNFLDARLYDEAHRTHLAKLAALHDALTEHHDTGGDQSASAVRRVVSKAGFARHDFVPNFVGKTARVGAELHGRIEALAPLVNRYPEPARKLSAMVASLGGKAAPTRQWMKEGKAALEGVDPNAVVGMIDAVMAHSVNGVDYKRDDSALRALIFLSSELDTDVIGPKLAQFAIRNCYAKQSGHGVAPGMRNQKLGNACVLALSEMPNGAGIADMVRIHARVKYPKVKTFIDKRLDAAAKKAGISRADLDEVTVATHGLSKDGALQRAITGGEAHVRIAAGSVALEWVGDNGKPLKSPSLAMKADKAAIKEVRNLVKEIKSDLTIQTQRLQRLYLQKRDWSVEDWRARYCQHPLIGTLARRLIWSIARADGSTLAVLPSNDGDTLCTAIGEAYTLESTDRMRLWHPIDASAEEVEAWRDRLEAVQVTQPFPQVWREVYVLTDAERTTETYSNRWAAHILRQHQTMELGRANGWRVTHRLGYDTPNNEPWHRVIADYGLVADYWVSGCGGEHAEYSQGGAYTYITTDRLQFHPIQGDATDSAKGPARGDAMALTEVPSIVFSEIMRHGDLFTSIASIGNDPTWLDDGREAQHPDDWRRHAEAYWHSMNTGDLEVAAQRRRTILERTIPRLKIADKLRLDDRFLHVQGTRGTYKIHLGAGGAFSDKRHMCIVPKTEAKAGKVWLPFEGDRTLSIILSKAMLLAADDKITDPVILAQLP